VSIFELHSLFDHNNIDGVAALRTGVAEVQILDRIDNCTPAFIWVQQAAY